MQVLTLKLVLIFGLVFPLFASTDPIKLKKQNFYKLIIPAVDKVYKELYSEYRHVKSYIEKKDIKNPLVIKYMKKYDTSDHVELLKRMKPHPKSIAIAQAAMESGWATSRFTKVANNLFGVWSFNKNEPRVPALKKRANKTVYLKKYTNVIDSIRDYYYVLSTARAFSEFRKQKMKTDDPYMLVKKLNKYSEKGSNYAKELVQMIKYNKLYRY